MLCKWHLIKVTSLLSLTQQIQMTLCCQKTYTVTCQTLPRTLVNNQQSNQYLIDMWCKNAAIQGNKKWFNTLFPFVKMFWSYWRVDHLSPYYFVNCPDIRLIGIDQQAHKVLVFILLSICHNQPIITQYFQPEYQQVIDTFRQRTLILST